MTNFKASAIQAVVFDLGGVIVRTEDFGPRTRLAARWGMTAPELEQVVYLGDTGLRCQRGEIPLEEHWQSVMAELGLEKQELRDFKREFWGGDRIDWELVDFIRSLRPRYRTALLSNYFPDLRSQLTERWKFADAFDVLIISSEVGCVKPEPRIYHLLLENLGLQPPQVVFIDDSRQNVAAAHQVGMSAIHFQTPDQMRFELSQLLDTPGANERVI